MIDKFHNTDSIMTVEKKSSPYYRHLLSVQRKFEQMYPRNGIKEELKSDKLIDPDRFFRNNVKNDLF